MPLQNDPRGLANARFTEQRGLPPGSVRPQYADATGRVAGKLGHVQSDVSRVAQSPPTLILVGAGLRSEGIIKIVPAADSKNKNQKTFYDRYEVPDIRKARGFKQAVVKYLETKNAGKITNPVVVNVDSEADVRAAIARAGAGTKSIQYLGHMKIGYNPDTNRTEAQALQLNGRLIMDRENFISLSRSVGAEPEIWGCFGSEGPGSIQGADALVKITSHVKIDKSAMRKAAKGELLRTGDLIINYFEE